LGRPRKIPKQSKALKYFYLFEVNFKGNPTLKFGISNNVYRRAREYNNSTTVGYLRNILTVYKCSNPKRLETILKYYMPQVTKDVYKQEYYDLKYYDFIKNKVNELAKQFGYNLQEIDFYAERERLIKK